MKQKTKYILSLFSSQILFCVSHGFAKLASHTIPITELLWFRYLPPLLLVIPLLKNEKLDIRWAFSLTMIFRAIIGMIAMSFMYLAFKYGHFGKANVLYATYALWTLLINWFAFKQKPSRWLAIALPCTFLGIGLMMKPKLGTIEIADIYALIAAVSTAFVMIFIGKLRKDHSALTIVCMFYLISGLFLTIPTLLHWQQPMISELIILAIIGISGLFAQYFMSVSFGHLNVSFAATFQLIGLSLMVITGWIFFNDPIDIYTIIGILITMTSLGLLCLKQ